MVDSKVLEAPKVKNGFLSQEAVTEFFAQVYQEPNILQHHASKLFGCLLTAAWYGKLRIKVRCRKCRGDLKTQSCLSPRSTSGHCGKNERRLMDISVADLRKVKLREFQNGTTHTGQAMGEDFELLSNYL